jgi:hypothetical protein
MLLTFPDFGNSLATFGLVSPRAFGPRMPQPQFHDPGMFPAPGTAERQTPCASDSHFRRWQGPYEEPASDRMGPHDQTDLDGDLEIIEP